MTHENYVHIVKELKRYDIAYFRGSPLITDQEYDLLYFAVQDYERENPDFILRDSPTQKAHAEVVNGHRKVYRRDTMLSTEKANSPEMVIKWMERTSKKTGDLNYTIEWKYDGLSASLVYVHGMLTEASYGKGNEGMDFLSTALYIPSIPKEIPTKCERIEVRGEVVVFFEHMKTLSTMGYKNCRSAASGILADTNTTFPHLLTFIPYWTDLPFQKGKFPTLHDRLIVLTGFGFYSHEAITKLRSVEAKVVNIDEIVSFASHVRPQLPFPIDGMVVKVKNMNKWESLGKTRHHPKFAIAYKFPSVTVISTIRHIQITTGETGKLTPVAHFDPVIINGSTYSKASVGSIEKLHELGIKQGSVVIVSLRNDVIPHIDGLAPADAHAKAIDDPDIVDAKMVEDDLELD